MEAARGKYIVTLDADPQNDPQDAPNLLAALDRFDRACGTRIEARSHGDNFIRIASSRIAKWVATGFPARPFPTRAVASARSNASASGT